MLPNMTFDGHLVLAPDLAIYPKIETAYSRIVLDGSEDAHRFFPPGQTGDYHDRNEIDNPFGGNTPTDVLALAIQPAVHAVAFDPANNVDPYDILNYLSGSTLEMRGNRNREQLFLHPIELFMDFSEIEVALSQAMFQDALGSGAEKGREILIFGEGKKLPVMQPFTLSATDEWFLFLHTRSGAAKTALAAADFATSAQGFDLFSVRCRMQYGRRA